MQRDVVHGDVAVDDPHGVAFFRDHPLHEHLLRIQRVVEHDDVARPRLADLVHQLVDDETIVILECGRHAQAVDTRDLEAERHDQHRVHDRHRQRLQAGQNLAAHPFPFREWVWRRIGHDRTVADRWRCQLERVAGQMRLDGLLV